MRSNFVICLVALSFSLLITTPVQGHGYLSGPFQPRNVVTGLTCPHCANGGGPCGEGGQWLASGEASDLNGSFTTPIHSIRGGDSLEFAVSITAPHQGHFVVELCKPNGNQITHECFSTRLKRDPSDTRYSPYVPEYPDIAIFQANNCATKGDQKVHFLIPSDVGDCEHCVLRWFWQTGNSCDSHPMTSSATATDAIRQWKSIDGCGVAITGMGSCGTNCPTEACANEQFKNCIDVKITGSGGGNTQAPPTSTQSSSTSSSSSSNNNIPSGCASWSSLSPEYVGWCRETACPLCDSMKNDAAQYKACIDHSQVYCTTGDSHSSTPTPTQPQCASWTGKTSSNDAYCKDTACPYCYSLADEATRQACFEAQKSFCSISNPTNPPPTSSTLATVSSSSTPSHDGASFAKRVVYLDWSIGTVEEAVRTSIDNGFNVVVLGFWLHKHDGGKMDSYWDAAEAWINLSAAKRDELITYVHSKGAKIILTVGGATENHARLMNSGVSGSAYGKMCAEKVIEAGLDGLDFDSEGWGPQDFSGKRGTQWLIDATKAARSVLPAGKIISHAPQGPYFSTLWAGQGGYGEINRQIGDMIDYYFVQYYNQGASNPYNSYSSLFESAQGGAVKEIIAQGVPQEKIVVGKFVTGNGGDGYINGSTLKQILCQGHQQIGFTAGGGIWMYDSRKLEETKQFGQALSSQC